MHALDALGKILDLENQRGYPDGAVVGGLDAFLDRWRDQLEAAIETAPLQGKRYADLSRAQRSEWVLALRSDGIFPVGQSADRNSLDDTLAHLKVGNSTSRKKLERMDVSTLRDLLYLFPHRHVDYSTINPISELEAGAEMTVIATVVRSQSVRIGPRPGAAKVRLSDSTGFLDAIWFRQNYLADKFQIGSQLVLSGRVQLFRGRARMDNPAYELLPKGAVERSQRLHAGNLLPVYPSTEGLAQRTHRNLASRALELGMPIVEDPIPSAIGSRHGMPSLTTALSQMHFPKNHESFVTARRRLAFEELFLGQIAVQLRRREWKARRDGVPVSWVRSSIDSYLDGLDFDLTSEQQEVLKTVLGEMSSDVPMGRLLQGEVGSGKTVVAVGALLGAASDRFQGAFMVPTEVLAEQHFLSMSADLNSCPYQQLPSVVSEATVPGFGDRPLRIALLTGGLATSVKRHVKSMLTKGEIDIVIGTHALFQETVKIPRLALVVVDEQHRFGVDQRGALTDQRPRPHLLCMTATPIPRSLALTLYGDLDLSTLRELPAGRQTVKTTWAQSKRSRTEANDLIIDEVRSGRQAFVVCPLIEPSDEVFARSAVEEYKRLSHREFAGLSIGLLHGRMAIPAKRRTMDQFRSGDLQVLVATPVIEVGIDVPNATVMLIESADRFGLSQLHQLRGRVGRGKYLSHCLLLTDSPSEDARRRLSVLSSTSDGFALADEDLRLRGPGEYLGTRQTGFANLKIASFQDVDILDLARHEVAGLLDKDPTLNDRDHRLLLAHADRMIKGKPGDIS